MYLKNRPSTSECDKTLAKQSASLGLDKSRLTYESGTRNRRRRQLQTLNWAVSGMFEAVVASPEVSDNEHCELLGIRRKECR